MPATRLTKTVIQQIPFTEAGQLLIRDSLLPGFGLRVGTRRKTYFVEAQVNRRTVRTTLGRADIISVDVARRKATVMLGRMAEGSDPNRATEAEIRSPDHPACGVRCFL